MENQTTCINCKSVVSPEDYFCPNCGKKLRDKPLSTTVLTQIYIYALSIFLPPLGLWPAIKYLRQPDEKSKIIGMVTIILTVISIIISVWLTINFVNSVNTQISQQLNMYNF